MNYNDHQTKKPAMSTPAPLTLTPSHHWEYQQEMRSHSKQFYAHVFACSECFPWRKQYCETGEQLRNAYANASKSLRKHFLGVQNEKDAP